jgi:hypothetical protein
MRAVQRVLNLPGKRHNTWRAALKRGVFHFHHRDSWKRAAHRKKATVTAA